MKVRTTGRRRFVALGVLVAACVALYLVRSRDAGPVGEVRAQIAAIHLTPRNPKLVAHATQQLTATGTFSDRSKQDVTAQVRWSSSAESVATVDDHGVVTAVSGGEATISAARGAVRSATTLTVTGP